MNSNIIHRQRPEKKNEIVELNDQRSSPKFPIKTEETKKRKIRIEKRKHKTKSTQTRNQTNQPKTHEIKQNPRRNPQHQTINPLPSLENPRPRYTRQTCHTQMEKPAIKQKQRQPHKQNPPDRKNFPMEQTTKMGTYLFRIKDPEMENRERKSEW